MARTLLPPPPISERQVRARFRARRWAARAVVLVGILVALAVDASPLGTLAFVFVLVVPFEKLFPRHRQRVRRRALGTDLAYALTSGPLGVVGLVVGVTVSVASLAWIPGLLLRPLVLAVPPLPRAVLGILLFDMAAYWAHRFSHEVPFLWRFHRIHHSTEQLDWVSGFRVHPVDGALLAPAFVLLLVAGFGAQLSGVLLVLQLVIGLFLHANVRWRWRPLHRIVITPEFHHWHHANELDAHNANYSIFLPLWDLLFGTYFMPRHRRPAVYGVDGPVSAGILGQLWDPVRGLRNPLRMLRHPRVAVRETRAMVGRGIRQMRASAGRRRRHRVVSAPAPAPG
jgi:sterol desaturase/sphingolipid hydroxylase (fatty acid hydroxylase superfamily)